MRERELRQHAKCSACGELIGHTGLPLFSVVTIKRHGIKVDAVRRQDGLAAMLGSPLLAGVMGADEEMTEIMDEGTFTLCEACAFDTPVLALLGIAARKEERNEVD